MKLTLEEVIRYLDALPAAELGKLADEVMARLGMSPIPAPAPHLTMVGAPVPETEEIGIPTFDVVLHTYGTNKLAVISAARKRLGPEISLADVKKLVDSAPVVLRTDLRRADAEELASELRRAGAEVHLR